MRLAVDSNPLLSALIGGQAKAVLEHPGVEEVVTVMPVMSEVAEHGPILAKKKGLGLDEMTMTLATLPVRVVPESEYRVCLAEAERRIGTRDADDVAPLALALAFRIPVWSNDHDFEVARVQWYTTADLLKKLSTRKG